MLSLDEDYKINRNYIFFSQGNYTIIYISCQFEVKDIAEA